MNARWRIVVQSVATAVAAYVVAGAVEATLIRAVQPTELELAWVSDIMLSVALGIAVYLWRHLRVTQHELAERERAELVIQTQLSIAGEMQRRYLPVVPTSAGGFEWAATLESAGKIGGDFYDFVEQSPGIWLVLVADVSGKGIPAAMALGSLRSVFRTLAREFLEPAQLVEQLGTTLRDEWGGIPYVTCIAASFDTNDHRLTYTNAGHPPGILLGTHGRRYLSRGGPPAGLLPAATFEQETLELDEGDVCLLVTDGVTEALDDGVTPAVDSLASSAREHPTSALDMCQAVMARALRGPGPAGVQPWEDDRTVVVVAVRETQCAATIGTRPTHDAFSGRASATSEPSRAQARVTSTNAS